MRLSLLLSFLLLLCEANGATTKAKGIKPLAVEVPISEYPLFDDDLDFKNIETAIERQLKAFDRRALKGSIKLGNKSYPLSVFKSSLLKFKEIVDRNRPCFEEGTTGRELCVSVFNEEIAQNFLLYRPINENLPSSNERPVHFTAYYSPVLKASLSPSATDKFAIYSVPKAGMNKLTREEIDYDEKLKGSGSELFYLSNPFELYMMHIEGGGAVEYVDSEGKVKRQFLSYAGNNGNKFKFISVYMKEKGYISDSSISVQREFLSAHPELWREIYSYCKGYIYFQKSKEEPMGMEDIPLTDGRSVAQDKKYYPRKGLLTFVVTEKPSRENGELKFKPFSRFFIDQDTGSAIQGEARADLYFGFGDEAKLAAETLNNYGKMYFLIAK